MKYGTEWLTCHKRQDEEHISTRKRSLSQERVRYDKYDLNYILQILPEKNVAKETRPEGRRPAASLQCVHVTNCRRATDLPSQQLLRDGISLTPPPHSEVAIGVCVNNADGAVP